ncbi:hypothetical protein LMG31506_02207 [Cupriavidus yeoncheonensis]|uniref:DUF2029 domain-containing protein n=1 Tax=Cupriavidus yeoncheonensis TaxID=1462994 RepID=A0A916NDH2_9BURK|nr:glycosyltransferase family 87 protein [Cupriavidus yeoncheonensis]CAG2140167.1 hypothetical protein LMG31506_02207 [Cupriavidus yeoncheonensis]
MKAGHWLTSKRLVFYPAAMLLAQILGVCILLYLHRYAPGDEGMAFSSDFRVFWSASHLALEGRGVDAYDINKLFPVLQGVDPALVQIRAWFYWFYPPTFLLVILPLAILPYLLSYAIFTLGTLFCYAAMLASFAKPHRIGLLILAFPPTVVAAYNGQNSFLTATLAGCGLMLLERRPVVAGVCIGLLALKPHLAILFPIALLFAHAWKAMLAAAVTALCLAVTSLLAFGTDTAFAFMNSIGIARQLATEGALPLEKMPTIFSAARLMGASTSLANGIHFSVALFGMLAVVVVWRKPQPMYLRASVLVLSSLLVSPHMFDYDLTWLALPIAWMGVHGLERGWRRGERELLVAAWISPLACDAVARGLSLQTGPLVILAMLGVLLYRARQATHAQGMAIEVSSTT